MLKVLIAEDSVILADMLEFFLNSESFNVCGLARTVQEAVSLADLHKPDLAVLDFRLADEGYGAQIPPLLKDNSALGILYVSGDPLTDKLTKADGDAYIQKPFSMYDLSRALRIIQDIRTNIIVSPSTFPKGFHLLKSHVSDRAAA